MRTDFLAKSTSLVVLLVTMFLSGGCGDTAKPPSAISLEQIPAEFGKAFGSANGETKEMSSLVVTAVQGKDLSKAGVTLDALARRPDLSAIQSRTVAGAAISVNEALREAEAKGDPQATEILDYRRRTK